MENNQVSFTELEEQLRADPSGARKKQVEDDLYATLTALRRHMDTGLPPDEFDRMTTFKVGLESALGTLDKSWSSFHQGR